MDKKKLMVTVISLVVVIAISASAFLLFNRGQSTNTQKMDEELRRIEEAKTIEFVVVRVLPSGFSPKEVTIKKGMIVRFTNPLENKAEIKWEGDTQYTSDEVYTGNDIATEVFENEGEYIFFDNSLKPKEGKVIVE